MNQPGWHDTLGSMTRRMFGRCRSVVLPTVRPLPGFCVNVSLGSDSRLDAVPIWSHETMPVEHPCCVAQFSQTTSRLFVYPQRVDHSVGHCHPAWGSPHGIASLNLLLMTSSMKALEPTCVPNLHALWSTLRVPIPPFLPYAVNWQDCRQRVCIRECPDCMTHAICARPREEGN